MWQLFGEHLDGTFYRRPYYRMMREILGDHRSARHGRLYAFDCAIFLYAHRLLWIAYVVHTDFKPILGEDNMDTNNNTQWNDWIIGYTYVHRETYDAFIFVAVYLFAAFYWFFQTTFWRLDTRRITWLWWYELVVKNQDAYRVSALPSEVLAERRRHIELWYLRPSTRRRVLVPSVAKGVYRSIAARVWLWWTLSNVDQRQLYYRRRLRIISNLSPQLRRWSILFLVTADYVAFVLQAFVVLLVFMVMIGLLIYEDTPMYSRFALIWICAEAYVFHYVMQRLVRSAIFFINCSILALIVYGRHVIEIARPVHQIIRPHRVQLGKNPHRNRNNNNHLVLSRRQTQLGVRELKRTTRFENSYLISFKKYSLTIKRQLADHNKVGYLLMRGSKEMFGNVLFAFMLTNLPINVYFVQRITFQTLASLDLAAMFFILWIQVNAALAVIFPVAWCCSILHSPKRFIPALQAIMRTGRWLPYKLKYDDLYGRLGSGPKIGISIGPMETITFRMAFEFILLYIAFILMAFSRKIEMDLSLAPQS